MWSALLNRYLFVADDPINETDPTGMGGSGELGVNNPSKYVCQHHPNLPACNGTGEYQLANSIGHAVSSAFNSTVSALGGRYCISSSVAAGTSTGLLSGALSSETGPGAVAVGVGAGVITGAITDIGCILG